MCNAKAVFTENWANETFPPERTYEFFDALFGDNEEGAYDITLHFVKEQGNDYEFAFELRQRPGCCLACNLTYGLPQVFTRHPIINAKGIAAKIASALKKSDCEISWKFLQTQEYSQALHTVPFIVTIN